MGVVYRGERDGSPEQVAIKTVRIPHASHLAGIRREIQALLQVRHPGIVRVLGEGVEDGLPWYAMELLEGRTLLDDIRATWTSPGRQPGASMSSVVVSGVAASLVSLPSISITTVAPASSPSVGPDTEREDRARPSGRPLAAGDDLPRVLQVIRELCETLAVLHGEGIIHRDLKPANIFLRGGVAPVLMDFGLAWRFPAAIGREVLDLAMLHAGTIGYMAPEQIQGEIVDARADLYSVGCILYEMVTGELPFVAGPQGVLWKQLFTNPTPPSELVEGVSPELGEIILRLLERRPRDRFGHADDVARALEAVGAARRPGSARISPRACVYRPELAGRDEAVRQLTLHVDRLVGGSGGCVLVCGESGIGKTHLCMAIAHIALARNLEVITGSCTPVVPSAAAAGGAKGDAAEAPSSSPNDAPLHVFHSLLRTIVDRCMEQGAATLTMLLGDRAKVLAACEPAIARLPGLEDYPDPPELPAKAARDRMLRCMAETIEAFAQIWPLLLVLDDLQWADELSIELLTSLSEVYFSRCPVLILGTYRVEQAHDRLEELGAMPGVTRVDLGKLGEESVGAMVSDMLAMSPPPGPFVRFLSRQSEGNPFFVAEYVRAAVAEGLLIRSAAGRWQLPAVTGGDAAYDHLPLPASLRELCGQRLSNLSPAARELMELTSVLGRDVEWGLLSGAAGMGDERAMAASRELVARHILEEAEPGRLRFLHDKLREAAHDPIPAERRAMLHGVAARAIEAQAMNAGDFPLLYAKLARHFAEAGDRGKAMEYLEKAGEHAHRISSSREAAGLFRELIALDEGARSDHTTQQERLQRARWERRVIEAHLGFEDRGPVLEHAGRALSWAGRSLPRSQRGWILRLLREIPVQAAHRIAPVMLGARGEARGSRMGLGGGSAEGNARRAGAVEASMTLGAIGRGYLFSDATIAVAAGLWSMNLAERAGGGAKLASAYALLGTMLGFCQLSGAARSYFALARGTAEKSNDEVGLLTSLYAQGYWLQSQGGEWNAQRALAEEAIVRARRLGDLDHAAFPQMLLASADILSGRLDASLRQFEALRRGALERTNSPRLVRSLFGLSLALIRLGRLAEAEARLEEARAAMAGEDSAPLKVRCLGLLALVQVRMGEIDRAITFADLVSSEPVKAPMLIGLGAAYGGAAEAYLARLTRAMESRPTEIAEAWRPLRRIVSKLRLTSLICPVGGPIYHHVQGHVRSLEGAPARAKRSWERGLAAAERLDLPYEQGIARVDLARAEAPRSAARRGHLDIAGALFSQMGCRYDLAVAEALRK